MEQPEETTPQLPTEQPISSEPVPAPEGRRRRRSPAPVKRTKRELSRNEKIRDFAIGFIGWWLVNGIVWAKIWADSGESNGIGINTGNPERFLGPLIVNMVALPLNVLVFIVLASLRRWVAMGVLATYVVNFAVAVILGAIANGICWIPFTTPFK
jgi:hypothetical protein